MVRDFKHSNSHHRKHTSKKYRKLSSSDDEQSKDLGKHHNCACHISYNDEPTNTTLPNNTAPAANPSLRKRMISIMGPSTVSNGNLATILSTDTSELCQANNTNNKTCPKQLDRKSCTEPRSRSKAKKCSKQSETIGRHCSKQHWKQQQRSNSCSRVNNTSSPLPRRNNICRKKVRHQCSKPPVKPPANIPKCPGCSKEFISPILLCCGHSLCKRCVTTFVGESDGTAFKCPSCETQIKLTGDEEELFCPNFIILRQTEFGLDNDDEESQDLLCAVCQSDYEADFYCDTCRDLLCHNCADAHQIVKYTRDHRIRDIDCSTDVSSLVKKRYYCADHEEEVVDTYCVPCQKCICKKCAHLYHRSSNHHCLPVSTATENVREEIRRQLFEFKSRSPNLQLALMDLQRAKRNLKEQANVTYAEITESMTRLTAALKEHEKKLHKKLEDVCQTKVSALKVQKRKIVVQLERFETLGTILDQLDHHGNNIETLQMRSAIRGCANFLEKNPYGKASCSSAVKNSIFFNSNEIKIKREVAKHGEIFHFTSNGEDTKCPLVKPRETNNNNNNNIVTDNTCCYHIVSNFEERVSVMTLLEPQATNELSLRKNAKRIRAKSNWMILKSRLPDVIKTITPTCGDRRTPSRTVSRRSILTMKRSCSRKREVSRAKKQKARANWMILRSHLSDLTTDSDITPRRRRLKKNEPFLFKTPHHSMKKRPNKINNRKAMRVKALRKRANANWLLVRSKIPDIVDYGRVTGRIFSSAPMFRTPSSSSLINHYRKKRSSPTIMRLKCFRAKKLRAQANWLLVASRAHDIARYPEKMRNQQRKQQQSSWDTYLDDLNKNRRKATRNKYVAGVLRARANWMLVRSRIPDIILYGKYQRYAKKSASTATTTTKSPLKQHRHKKNHPDRSKNRSVEDFIYRTSSPQSPTTIRQMSPTKYTLKIDKDSKKTSKKQRSGDANGEKKRRGSKHHHHSHRHHRSSTKINKSPRSTLTKKRKGITQAALENWGRFIENTKAHQNRAKDEKHKKSDTTKDQDAVYKNWDDLLKGDIRNSSCRSKKATGKHTSPSHKKKLISDAALHHWDSLTNYTTTNEKRKLNKNKAKENWNKITKNTPGQKQQKPESSKAHQNWDHLTKNTSGQKPNNSKAHKNWDHIIKNTPGEKPNNTKAHQNWDHLIKNTTGQKPNNSKAHQNWDHLIKNTTGQKPNNSKAHQNWDHLIKNTSGQKPNNSKAHQNWDHLIKNTSGQKPNNSKAHQNWDHLTKNTQASSTTAGDNKEDATHRNWDILIQNTAREIKEKSSLRSHDAFMNWDNLMRDKTTADPKKSYAEWDHLISATSTLSPSRHAEYEDKVSPQQVEQLQQQQQKQQPNMKEIKGDPQSMKHWRHLVDSAKREKRNAHENWRQLTGNSQRERETAERHWTELVRSTKTNPSNHRRSSKKHKSSKRQSVKKGWDKIRTSLGRNLTPQMDSSQPVLGTDHQERAYKNWWALVSGSSDREEGGEEEDIREKAVRTNQLSEAIQNWNALLQGTFYCKGKLGRQSNHNNLFLKPYFY